ncbi:hypothetical protein D3C81_1016030 [compost metagenome]
MNVHRSEFGASIERRNVLAGIEQAVGVEGFFNCVEKRDLVTVELGTHLVDLFATYPVFTGNASAHSNAKLKNFGAQCFCSIQLAWLIGIEKDKWVHVSVSSMEDVSNA